MKAFRKRPALALLATAALAVVTAAVVLGWFSAGQLSAQNDAGAEANNDVVVLAAALEITRQAGELAAVSSTETQRGMTEDDLRASGAAVKRHGAALTQQLAILSGKGHDARVARIARQVNLLVTNAASIERGRPALLKAITDGDVKRRALSTANTTTLIPAATNSTDSQFYGLNGDVIKWSFQNDARQYQQMKQLESDIGLGHTLLGIANLMQDPTYVARTQEGFDSTAERMQRSIAYLSVNRPSALDPKVIPLAKNLIDAGRGDDNFFDRLEQRLELAADERNLIAENEKTLEQLLFQIDSLAAEVTGQDLPAAPPTDDLGTPGVTDTEILFGQSAALEGPSKALGLGMQLGIQAAFKEANDAGGVNGRKLELTTLDDRYETDFAFAQTLRLLERDRVFGLIGAVGTPTSRAASPVANEAGAPFVGPFTGAQFLRDAELDNVLNVRASYHQETEKMVAYLAGQGVTRVAVLYQNDSYGRDGLEGARRALDRRGNMNLVGSWYYQRNTSAVKMAASRLADANPQAVIMISSYAPAAQTIELLREQLGPETKFMAVSFVGSNALADALGDAGEGVYVTQVVPLPDDQNSALVAKYRAALSAYKSDAVPGFVSLEGYLAGRLAIEGLKECGADVSRQCFLNAVRDTGTINLDGFQLSYGARDNQGSDAVFLTRIDAEGNYRLVR